VEIAGSASACAACFSGRYPAGTPDDYQVACTS
jgi:hypothetical protein